MGLKFEGSDLLPDLKRGITFASLNTWGKVFLSIHRLYIYVKVLAIKGAERRSISFPSKPSAPFVFDCFKWHTDLYTSLTLIKGSALALWLIFCVQYCSSTVSSLLGELSVLITLLATLQKWLFTSSGEIPLVVLVFAGGCLLVSRLIARHVSFESLPIAKMSPLFFHFFFFKVSDHVDFFVFVFCIHQIVSV